MKFIADAMLGRLARRLRLLGHDVVYSPHLGDNELLRHALEEGRTLLTRDTSLAARPLAKGCLLIMSDRVDEQLRQVIGHFPSATEPFTRCSVCNDVLTEPPPGDVRDLVPRHVRDHAVKFLGCPSCGRIYWPGSHVRRLRGGK